MKRTVSMSLVTAIALGGTLCAADDLSLFSDVKTSGQIRARYESADDKNNATKGAHAETTRISVGIDAKLFQVDGLSAKLEGTGVANFGMTDYNGGKGTDAAYDKILDPSQARITQAYIDYKSGGTLLRAGRQIVNLDNQRFVGSVDWRQMPQSFDAVTVINQSVKDLTLIGSYVYGINRITYQDNIISNKDEAYDTKSVILNGSYKIADALKLTAYGYLLASINNTYGVSATGNTALGGVKLDYRAEYARQSDATIKRSSGADVAFKTGTPDADARYYNLDLGADMNGIQAGVNYEFLSGSTGSDGKTAFSTPLATLHAFNGWADMFLTTPTGGLVDKNGRIGYADKSLGKLLAVYHTYGTDKAMAGKSDLGSEWDLLYTRAVPGVKGLTGMLKAAYYKGGDVAGLTQDATKLWAQLDYRF